MKIQLIQMERALQMEKTRTQRTQVICLLLRICQKMRLLGCIRMMNMSRRIAWHGRMKTVMIKTVLYGLISASVLMNQNSCTQCAQSTAYPSPSTTPKTAKPGKTPCAPQTAATSSL
jgi:uncharacterized protein with NRDE domain